MYEKAVTEEDDLTIVSCGNPEAHLPHIYKSSQTDVKAPVTGCYGVTGPAPHFDTERPLESPSDIDEYIERWLEEHLEDVITDIFERRLQEKLDEGKVLEPIRIGMILNQLTGKDCYDTQG